MREPLDQAMERLVFDPLGMHGSSYVWSQRFSRNVASAHETEGIVKPQFMPDKANAAYSLHTTASDYGQFLGAVTRGTLLEEATARLWLTPHIQVPKVRFEALEKVSPEIEPGVAWGLGWGLEPDTGVFFHWGANPGATAFALGVPARRTAFVVFMNGDAGLSIVPKLVEVVLPGPHPALEWLGLSVKS